MTHPRPCTLRTTSKPAAGVEKRGCADELKLLACATLHWVNNTVSRNHHEEALNRTSVPTAYYIILTYTNYKAMFPLVN